MTNETLRSEELWSRHVDDRRGFSLEYPSEWQMQRGMSGLLVSFAAPRQSEGFAANLNVVRRVDDTALDLDGIAQVAVREILRLLTDVTLIDADATVVADSPARRLLFAYRQGIYGLTGEQWLFRAPGHLWTVTAGASSEEYDALAPIFARITGSLRVGESRV